MTISTTRRVVMIGLVMASSWSASVASEKVSVRLRNGTTVNAELDARTDEDRLWLRFGGGTTIVLRSIPWSNVASATHRGKRVPVTDLPDLAVSLNDDQHVQSARVRRPPTSADSAFPSGATHADHARRALGMRPMISDVQFDASLANWDRDVEADGLLVRVKATDHRGISTAVAGVLDIELIAMRTVAFHHAPHSRGQLPRTLARWTKRIAYEDFTSNGATVKLPFQASHPEFDTTWAPHCLAHVRLVVPGQGVFERSLDGVRIRPFAPFRDMLELQRGQRFLPSEETSTSAGR